MSLAARPRLSVAAESSPPMQAAADPDAVRSPRAPPTPASVKINVEGAFIVDDELNGKAGGVADGVHYEHKDIRLPHHTAVVSHVAVDVGHASRRTRSHTDLTYL